MANKYIINVYQDVYKETFDKHAFSNRLKMQKLVYLIEQKGIEIGGYSFSWYKHGPYSQQLQDDIYISDSNALDRINYTPKAEMVMENLSNILQVPAKCKYTQDFWAECVASLHYLAKNIMHFNASEDDVVTELEKQKPHLCDHSANLSAFRLAKMI